MGAKPASKSNWTVGNPDFATVTQEPTANKKEAGWLIGEEPPREYFNWLFWIHGQWLEYLEEATDGFASAYQAVIGGANKTHDDINAAMADANITNGSTLLIAADQALNSTQDVTKDDITLQFLPGVVYSQGGGNPTVGIKLSGVRGRIKEGRMTGFDNAVGDSAIEVDADYCTVKDMRFASNNNDVKMTNAKSQSIGNIVE